MKKCVFQTKSECSAFERQRVYGDLLCFRLEMVLKFRVNPCDMWRDNDNVCSLCRDEQNIQHIFLNYKYVNDFGETYKIVY